MYVSFVCDLPISSILIIDILRFNWKFRHYPSPIALTRLIDFLEQINWTFLESIEHDFIRIQRADTSGK